MAREGLRSHLSGSVPVSIVAHLVVLLVLVVIPLADIVLPIPLRTMPSYVLAAALPPPPAPQPLRPLSTSSSPTQSDSTAPTSAPPRIEPEAPSAPPSIAAEGGIDGAFTPGTGVDGAVGPPSPPPPVPEPPRAQAPVRAAQLPELPRKTVDARPVYPEIARTARVQGTVILEAVLDTTGRVTQLKVIRSVPLLDQAALDAVRQWRYTPSIYAGRPVSVLLTITVRFTLSE